MPGLIPNSAAIVTELGLGTNAAKLAERAFKHQAQAELKLRSLISDEAYDQLLIAAPSALKSAVTKAEAYLCLYFGLPVINLRLSEMGGLSKVIGSEAGDSREELMSGYELEKVRGVVLNLALGLIDSLIPEAEDGDDIVQAGSISFIGVKGEEGALW